MKVPLLVLSLLATMALHAGSRTSASYNVPTDTCNGGGTHSASPAYTNNSSVGEIAGVSTVAVPAETAKAGYIAQLYEVTALQIAATPVTVNETANRQLAGSQWLDDLTTLAVPANSIIWSIVSGPLSNISTGGLVTAGTVYQNTAAEVQGSYLGNSGFLGLTVLDTLPDNYSTYAGDGISDNWQVQYFGLSNPNAAPLLDPEFDGVLNLMEFATALNPTMADIIPVETVKNGSVLEFTYPRALTALAHGLGFVVEWSNTLNSGDWHATGVTEQILSNNGTVQQVKATVPAGGDGHRFVHLKVTSPP